MKCAEVEKSINLLLDQEADEQTQPEIKAHLAGCRQCREEFETVRKTRALLAAQPSILPKDSFDNRMLQMFESKLKKTPEPKKSWFAGLLFIPRPSIAFALVIFVAGLLLAFQVGRWSALSQSHLVAGQEAKNRISPMPLETPTLKHDVSSGGDLSSDKTVTKTVIKYVKVPVIKTRFIERPIDAENAVRNSPVALPKKAANHPVNFAGRMNLKDLQPIANVTYKIIKKGENNEE